MFRLGPLTPLFVAITANALSLPSLNDNVFLTRSNVIHWGPCDTSFETAKPIPSYPIDCANLTVPLDYTNPNSTATINLELLRIPAYKKPSNGSILFNFGGPGDDGRMSLAAGLDRFLAITGNQNDLIVFDPRGTVNTLTMSCYNDTERAQASLEYPAFSNASDTAVGTMWTSDQVLANLCHERLKDIGSYVGTAFVARDLMSVVDALDEDGMLRYWGGSYGTVLGATVAAMFPDRIDRMVLDGVDNSHEYYHAYEVEWLTDSDKTFAGFFSGCVATPDACPLARDNKSADQLESDFYSFLDNLKYHPLTDGSSIVAYPDFKNLIILDLYAPSLWPQLAVALDRLYRGNITAYTSISSLVNTSLQTTTPESVFGIKCSEKSVRTPTLAGFIPAIEAKYNVTRILGDVFVHQDMMCANWEMQAKEVYQGDFMVRTKNPVLFISNTYDPVTPIVSGKNMSSGFEGSVLLEHHGYGHASIAQPSVCTIKATQKYYHTGELPASGTICEPDIPLFSNKTWNDVMIKLNSTS
ncbi:hypothetical protein BT63DRAFT_397980 [Microthyrium microscopicum]|uniref:Peptidase S33 tripeptidyl aminopeptidase-like C-terminal domain-containing protein n=1 Tax=Microthyrium microscopicum TaxID=703497 RepID=A0A6A6UH51_9PEZI|nr:hypothetical protein BT63DRAFT_397980 [Microthyrium microscopicum]